MTAVKTPQGLDFSGIPLHLSRSRYCCKGEYYYLKFRDNGKMHDVYIGKDPAVIENVRDQLDQRKHYSRMPVIGADIVKMIVEKRGVSEPDAIKLLYKSKTYEVLQQEWENGTICFPDV